MSQVIQKRTRVEAACHSRPSPTHERVPINHDRALRNVKPVLLLPLPPIPLPGNQNQEPRSDNLSHLYPKEMDSSHVRNCLPNVHVAVKRALSRAAICRETTATLATAASSVRKPRGCTDVPDPQSARRRSYLRCCEYGLPSKNRGRAGLGAKSRRRVVSRPGAWAKSQRHRPCCRNTSCKAG